MLKHFSGPPQCLQGNRLVYPLEYTPWRSEQKPADQFALAK